MTIFRIDRWATAAVLLAVLCCFGCSRDTAPPADLTEAELPAALQKAFSKAKPEPKSLADQVVAAVQAKDYSKAYQGIQNLAAMPGLSKDQQSVAARAVITLNNLLASAQPQGDTKAAEALKSYRINK